MQSQPKELIGRRLGNRYLVERLLGHGGMADVFQGRDQRLGREVAVKVLRPEFQADGALRRRFESEARSAARLSHPNVVGLYDVGEDGDIVFLVMELLDDETLADRIRIRPLTEDEARRVGLEILAALGAAHGAGVLHRDVKPANVLFGADGSAKLADFGIAKALEKHGDPDDLTKTSLVLGTPAYLAPERAEGAAGSPASDLWAVGVVLYEALSGTKPFGRPTALASALAARQGTTEPLDVLRPGLSPGLVAIIDKALCPRPEDRFASATDMADAIRTLPPPDPMQTLPMAIMDAPGAALASTSTDLAVTAPAAATAVWEAKAPPARGPAINPPPTWWHRWPWLLGIGLAALAVTGIALMLSSGGGHKNPSSPSRSNVATSTTLPTTTTSLRPTTPTTAPPPTTPTTAPPPTTPTTAPPPTTPTTAPPPTTPPATPPTPPATPPTPTTAVPPGAPGHGPGAGP
jgi:serine/threonine protein kinase